MCPVAVHTWACILSAIMLRRGTAHRFPGSLAHTKVACLHHPFPAQELPPAAARVQRGCLQVRPNCLPDRAPGGCGWPWALAFAAAHWQAAVACDVLARPPSYAHPLRSRCHHCPAAARHAVTQGRQIDPRTFPEAILNGSKLDLFHLYK